MSSVKNLQVQLRAPSTTVARARWREARQFEARTREVLGLQRTSFVEWLLLQTLSELKGGDCEGVAQNELARRTGLSRKVVSYWMIVMADFGLVDRGQGEDPRSLGVLISERGEELLRACNERLAAAGLTE
jgi:DNA-binding MarR family transcriptional regulator